MLVKKIKTSKATKTTKALKVVKEKKVTRKRVARLKTESVVPESPFLASTAHGHILHETTTVLPPRRDSRKQLTIILGVSALMTLIIIAWILNLKRLVGSDVVASKQETATNMEFSDLKEELSTTINDVRGKLSELNAINQESPTSTISPDVTEEMRDIFLKSLESESLPSSTITPSASPTTTITPPTLP